MAPLVRTGGSRHTGLAAPPHRNIHLSHSTVANMFNRNNAPTFPTLEAICNAFQMTLSQFFCEDGNLIELTDEEKELISRWKQLSAEQRKVLLELMGVI